MQTPALSCRASALPVVALATLAAAYAQPASRPSTSETVTLSPFTVSTEKDTGYQATDSLLGGRIATTVLTTPADQTILTREFLDDIGALSYAEAGIWLTSAVVTPPGGTDFGQAIVFRGVSPAGYPYRNYFRSLGPVDDYIVERLDNSRGPNSLIFGDGVIGGIINTSTKRAQLNRPRTDARFVFDTEGSQRGAIDVNRNVTSALAARVNLLAERGRRFSGFRTERLASHGTLTFRPWPKSEFRIEGEAQDTKAWGAATSVFTDQITSWNGTQSATGPLTANPGNGINRLTTSKITYGVAYAGTGPLDYLNYAQSTGSGLSLSEANRQFNVVLPRPSRHFQFITENSPTIQRQIAIGFYFEKTIGDNLAFELAAHRSRQDRTTTPSGGAGAYYVDVNTLLPNGAPNPKFGHVYTENTAGQSSGDNRNTDYRFAGVYTFPVRSFSQRINLLAGWREEDFTAVSDTFARSNGAIVDLRNAANATYVRRYFSDGSTQNLTRPRDGQNGYTFAWVRTQDRLQKQELRNVQLATVGSYWRERLHLIAGLGYYDYKQYQKDIVALDARGNATRIGYSAITEPVSTVRHSIGGVFFPIKQVGLYYNRSTSFSPVTSGDPGLDGKQFDPTDGSGFGTGLRFNLLGGRATGSVGYYSSTEKKRVTSYSASEINSIWTDLALTQRLIPTTNYRDLLDYKATGWEGEFTANVTRSVRLFGNIAFPETSQTNTIPGTRAYFAANIAQWQAAADNPAQFNRTNIQNQINTLRTRIEAAAEGRPLNATQKFSANLFANYSFTEGALKGLRLGGGANFIGRRLIGNQANLPFAFYYGEARTLVTASAGYDFKVRRVPINVQLNVSNLLDYDKPVYTGVSNTLAIANRVAIGNGYFYDEPRKARLTTTVRF